MQWRPHVGDWLHNEMVFFALTPHPFSDLQSPHCQDTDPEEHFFSEHLGDIKEAPRPFDRCVRG